MAKKMLTRVQNKHDIEANWKQAVNFTPLVGEIIVYDPDEAHAAARFKIGDGKTLVNDLPFKEFGYTSTYGYYITAFDGADNSITLSTKPFGQEGGTAPAQEIMDKWLELKSFDDKDPDHQYISFDAGFFFAMTSQITGYDVTTGKVFVDYLPIDEQGFNAEITVEEAEGYYIYAPYSSQAGEVLLFDSSTSQGVGMAAGYCSMGINYSQAIGPYSFAANRKTIAGYGAASFGQGTIAYGNHSFVQGTNTEATVRAQNGHAEGYYTISDGFAAHAEGVSANAFGDASHAEGQGAQSNGNYSHAEGQNSKANGEGSHAEGTGTIAAERASHAEGWGTQASAKASHTEGNGSVAKAEYSHAEGHDAKTGDETALDGYAADYAHAEGENTVANGYASHAEGYQSKTMAAYAHAEGRKTIASGYCAHSEGYDNTASGSYSHVEGYSSDATANYAHAEGVDTLASNAGAHSEGTGTIASGEYAHSEGKKTTAQGNHSHTEGENNMAIGVGAHAEGLNTTANGNYSHTEGRKTQVVNVYGEETYSTTSMYAHAEGDSTIAFKEGSHAEGYNTKAVNHYAHAEGRNSIAQGEYSHAEGRDTVAKVNADHSEGWGTIANGQWGSPQHVSGKYNIEATFAEDGTTPLAQIIGNGTDDGARSNAYTLDYNGNAWFAGSVKVGDEELATKKYVDENSGNITVDTVFDLNSENPIANNTVYRAIEDLDGFIRGVQSDASSAIEHIVEFEPRVETLENDIINLETKVNNIPVQAGEISTTVIMGTSNASSAQNSMVHGEGNTITEEGREGHAEGWHTKVANWAAHAEGVETEANGLYSHAEGNGSIANGTASHAEGQNTQVGGVFEEVTYEAASAHAEGKRTKALGYVSHAEGWETVAIGEYSHAEGTGSRTNANESHAEGKDTIANAAHSHTEGRQTETRGRGGHAEGVGTVATSTAATPQHAEGRWNLIDDSSTYAHIIGNGTATYNETTGMFENPVRSNAYTLDWSGNAWFAGNITVGTDRKTIATEEYVTNLFNSIVNGNEVAY